MTRLCALILFVLFIICSPTAFSQDDNTLQSHTLPGQIAYFSANGDIRLWRDGLSSTIARSEAVNCRQGAVRFSSNGQYLAYIQGLDTTENSSVVIQDLTSDTQPLVPVDFESVDAEVMSLDWIPNKKQIVLSVAPTISNQGGDIWLFDFETEELRKIFTDDYLTPVFLNVSSFGDFLAFTTSGVSESLPADYGYTRIISINTGQTIQEFPLYTEEFDWSPTGDSFVFRARTDLRILNAPHFPSEILYSSLNLSAQPHWSSQGDQIAFLFTDSRSRLQIFDVAREEVSEIPLSFEIQNIEVWSPDGQYLLVNDGSSLWAVSVSNGHTVFVDDGQCADWSEAASNQFVEEPPTDSSEVCYDNLAPTNIRINSWARVIPDLGSNNLRETPSLSGSKLPQSLQPGDEFYVISGPICADEFRWWLVWVDSNTVAWTADGDANNRWIELSSGTIEIDVSTSLQTDIVGIWRGIDFATGLTKRFYSDGMYSMAGNLSVEVGSYEVDNNDTLQYEISEAASDGRAVDPRTDITRASIIDGLLVETTSENFILRYEKIDDLVTIDLPTDYAAVEVREIGERRSIPLYSQPSWESDVVSYIDEGGPYRLLNRNDNDEWLFIEANNSSGWIKNWVGIIENNLSTSGEEDDPLLLLPLPGGTCISDPTNESTSFNLFSSIISYIVSEVSAAREVGFPEGQCTDLLDKTYESIVRDCLDMGADAGVWDDHFRQNCSHIPITATPQVGDIAVWEAGAANNEYGHVALVEKVNSDNTFDVYEYNWAQNTSQSCGDNRRCGLDVESGISFINIINTNTICTTTPLVVDVDESESYLLVPGSSLTSSEANVFVYYNHLNLTWDGVQFSDVRSDDNATLFWVTEGWQLTHPDWANYLWIYVYDCSGQ